MVSSYPEPPPTSQPTMDNCRSTIFLVQANKLDRAVHLLLIFNHLLVDNSRMHRCSPLIIRSRRYDYVNAQSSVLSRFFSRILQTKEYQQTSSLFRSIQTLLLFQIQAFCFQMTRIWILSIQITTPILEPYSNQFNHPWATLDDRRDLLI